MQKDLKEAPRHPVHVLPLDATIMVPDGSTLMRSALAQGYKWPNVCNGEVACGVCWVLVEQGMEHTSPAGHDEQVRLDVSGKSKDPNIRLACQIRVFGPMTVRKRGVALQQVDLKEGQRGT